MVLDSDVPVHSLRVLATHVAVWTLEAWHVDALQPIMSTHAAGSAEGARTPGTGKTAPVQGSLKPERVPGIPHRAVILLQDDRSEVYRIRAFSM